MPISALDKYLDICKELKEGPLHQLKELLKFGARKIDVSKIYLPRKHLQCLFRFLEERPDTEELILDGTFLTTEDVNQLKECLLRSCVMKISLRRIKLDAASATTLRQLCMNNSGIVEIDLEGTCIPTSKIDEIQLIVNLNRLNAESLLSSSVVNARNESSRVDRWRLCRERCKLGHESKLLPKPCTARDLIDEFAELHESFFCDSFFNTDNFDHPLSNVETVRWSTYCKLDNSQKCVENKDEFEFQKSAFYKNANLCAALNALVSYDTVSKSILFLGVPRAGVYVFHLFVDGAVTEVIVDDTLPCLISGGKFLLPGVNSCCYPFYGALLEKAIAKLIGGYRKIEELSFCDCIELLTGGTTFEINLTSGTRSTTATFELLRSLSEKGRRLVACLIPRSQREAQACENDGISCGVPYFILKADVCGKNGSHYAFVLQVATPFQNKAVKYAFEYDTFESTVVNGRLVIWMTLEDFAVVFGQVYLFMWSFDDAASEHKTTNEFQAFSSVSTNSTLFANNPAFYVENEGNGASGVMVSLRSPTAVDVSNKAKCLFFKYVGLVDGAQPRRYDICDKNALFASDEFSCNEGSIFFNLLPREKLQFLIASQTESSITVSLSTVENVKVSALPDSMMSSTLIGSWNTTVKAKRLSDQLVCLVNESAECNRYCVIALAQSASPNPPFPIGAFGWVGKSSDVVNISAPQFSTTLERSVVSVNTVFLPIYPKECLFILPFCCGGKCPDTFELTIFTVTKVTKAVFSTADFL